MQIYMLTYFPDGSYETAEEGIGPYSSEAKAIERAEKHAGESLTWDNGYATSGSGYYYIGIFTMDAE